jgi:hypothetical protein
MTRKSILLGLALVLGVTGAATAGLVALIRREPDFYRQGATRPGKERKQKSQEFVSEFCHLYNEAAYSTKWEVQFSEEQINSYFDEDFVGSGLLGKSLPEGIREPRIDIDANKLRLAFRYGTGAWSFVISVELRLWLTEELNVVALEVLGLRAGSLPISAQSFLDQASEVARAQNIDVTWYRHHGNPVALLRFQADHQHPTIQLQRLSLQPGKLVISGAALQTAALRDMFGPMALMTITE